MYTVAYDQAVEKTRAAKKAHNKAYVVAMKNRLSREYDGNKNAWEVLRKIQMETIDIALQRSRENRPVTLEVASQLQQQKLVAKEAEINPSVKALKEIEEKLQKASQQQFDHTMTLFMKKFPRNDT